MKQAATVARVLSPAARYLLAMATLLLLMAGGAIAQTARPTDGSTPSGLAPGSPAGSYALSGFDNINLYNGNLSFRLPLLKIGGRGSAQYTMTLAVERHWTVTRESYITSCLPSGLCNYAFTYRPTPGWWGGAAVGYGPGVLQGRQVSDNRCGTGAYPDRLKTKLTRLTFTAPDGTEFELRDAANDGKPIDHEGYGICNNFSFTTASRGTVFVTADGTAATFTSDTTIYDHQYPDVMYLYPSGYLVLRDGTRYRIDSGLVTWLRDRNGNKLSFTYDTSKRVTSITDSLNRQVTITYGGANSGVPDEISFKGTGGAPRMIRVHWSYLEQAFRSGYTPKTYKQLFPPLDGSSTTNYTAAVVSSVELPDTRRYQLRYNSYGELARVELPTGGAFEYDYGPGLNDAADSDGGVVYRSETIGGVTESVRQIYRRVVERRVYTNGVALAGKMTYGRPEGNLTNLGYVQVDGLTPSGALLSRARHYYGGSPVSSMFQKPLHYSSWADGREHQTEVIDDDGTTVLRRAVNTWQQRAAVSWWTNTAYLGPEPPKDPRLIESTTTLVDTNQVSKQTFDYDEYNNQTDVSEYDYGAGAAGPLVRRTHTDYLTTNLIGGTAYNYATDAAIHLRSLPKQVSVYDATDVERARTFIEYDNYTATAPHAALTARADISGLDSAYTTSKKTRGNVTATTRYLLNNNGTVAGSVSAYQQYDVAGNVVKAIDSLVNETTFAFTDSFGGPDAGARANSVPPELAPQSGTLQSYAFPSAVTNDKGHTVFIQRDYYTGLVVDSEDPNGVTSSAYYDDDLDRPTKVIRAASDQDLRNQTVFTYDDTLRVITTATDFDAFDDTTPLKSQTLYDGLGRTTETRTFETATTFIAVRQTYDALGRVNKVSNPFRTGTPVWTTTAYDALGRVVSVSTPDDAAVTTSYSGDTTTVADQTGKDRKSVTDALGRLTQVVEDPGTGGLGYVTEYTYDVLDNLRRVKQDSQYRYFMYDSLSRLIRLKHPEQDALASLALTDPVTTNSQWSIAYTYDNNGNLLTRTDARNLKTEYGYDELNRNTSVTYKSGTVIQARVVRTYDTATNGVGRPAASSHYLDTGTNAEANSQTAIDSYDALGRPLSQSQYFYSNGSWGTAFITQRAYNLAGAVKSQTYPSGRIVNYGHNLAGRTLSFTGNLGDGVTRNYATSITYDQWGGLTRERFGTTTPLYHKERRNIRGQLYDIRLSTVNDADNWNRGAVINHYTAVNYGFGNSGTDNNGNLLFQQHWVPDDDAITSSSFMQQNYDYDQLNRIKWVAEYPDGNAAGSTGSQNFGYDRWGNRTIDPASFGTGINEQQFTVNVGNKNQLGVPAGVNKVMQYDAAGNLYNDTYGGTGARTFDHESRMVTATNTGSQQSVYTYDADGLRVRRKSYGVETWQVYGMEGELLAEYAAGAAPSSPQKEYGYRNGQLLLIAAAEGRKNVALASEGAVAAASSQHSTGTPPAGAINGDRRGVNWGSGGGWADSSTTPFPEWLQVDFAGTKTIDEIDVFSLQDGFATLEPTETMTFTQYGLTDFEVQYWNGSSWVTVTGGGVTGNDKVWRKFTFAAVSTSKIRVHITGGVGGRARIIEVEAWQSGSAVADVRWLVPDHLGTPRMIADNTGSLAGISRHDYLPFGEELVEGAGNRTTLQGYPSSQDNDVRQQFTQKERDKETGLDHFGARYYSYTQGRFISIDPGPSIPADPQSFNRYAYVQNNPLKFIDPNGEILVVNGEDADYIVKELERYTGYKLKRDEKTGVVSIDRSVRRKTGKGISDNLAKEVEGVIRLRDGSGKDVTVTLNTVKNDDSFLFDNFQSRTIDISDYKGFKGADKSGAFVAGQLGHVLEEYAKAETDFKGDERFGNGPNSPWYQKSHDAGLKFESKVLSDYTGVREQPRVERNYEGVPLVAFEYTSIRYLVMRHTRVVNGQRTVIQSVESAYTRPK